MLTVAPPRASLAPRKPPLVIDQDGYDKAMKAKGRGEWWKSGVLCLGAFLGTGLIGVGVDLGLQKFVPTYASTVNTALSPALWGFFGGLSGALTFLFVQKVTEPTGAWVSRFASKGSPIKWGGSSEMSKELVEANQGSNAADSRALVGAAQADGFIQNMLLVMPLVSRELEKGDNGGFSARAAAIKNVGDILGRRLVWQEVVSFAVIPDFKNVFKLVRQSLHGTFEPLSETDQKTIIDSALEVIRRERPKPTDPKIPPVDAAIEKYFRPVLETIVAKGG